MRKDLNRLSALEARHGLAAGAFTAEALVASCLERIAEREDAVQAWFHLGAEQALAAARIADRSPERGVLHGLPIGIKDVIDTVDMPTGHGTPIYEGNRPAWDAACVAAARTAGAVMLGKTVTAELATYSPGKTRNPWNLGHTPGGSSSGSAAAVADFMVPLAYGTQTGGSIIRPASFCGVVGYKPSFGLVPRSGVKMLSDTLDTIGLFARSVEDVALFASAVAGRPSLRGDGGDCGTPRIGVCRTPQWDYAETSTRRALDSARVCLERAGGKVSDVVLPPPFDGLAAAQTIIQAVETARSLAYERLHVEMLTPALRRMIAEGDAVAEERYQAAMDLGERCRMAFKESLGDIDVLLAPSVRGEAPAGLESTGDPIFNRMWTLLHVPCVQVPAVLGPAGLPIGVQIIGPRGDDARVLRAAEWIAARLGEWRP